MSIKNIVRKEENEKPSKEEFRKYIIIHNMNLDSEKLYDLFEKRNWKKRNGQPVKSWTAMINSYNGVKLNNFKKIQEQKKEKLEKLDNRQEKKFMSKILRSKKTVSKIFSENIKIDQNYSLQLEDPRWKSFRKFVFDVRGRKCELCGSEKDLQVHHIHYFKGLKAWEYSVKDVRILCRECHKRIHGITNE